MDIILNKNRDYFSQYWTVENTGWSGGISWFPIGIRRHTKEEAIDAAKAIAREVRLGSETKWRIVCNTVETFKNKSVQTKEWEELCDL